ncbi:MAG: stage II sporulation protein P [Oscillospiraceae bacterium]|nr:stage II sporulation protein P [Oscillospiraceae bacterium]
MDREIYSGRRSRVKAGTAALLTAAIFFGAVKAANNIPHLGEKLLVASAALELPQGAAVVLEHCFGEAETAPPTAPESAVSSETESSQGAEEYGDGYPMWREYPPAGKMEESETEQSSETAEDPFADAAPNTLGVVTEKHYSASAGGINIKYGAGIIKNSTSHSKEQVQSKLEGEFWFENMEIPEFSEDEPLVLIVHTHATESYERYNTGKYDKSYSFRSSDNRENMVAVGEVLAETLKSRGISAVQATVQHDNPSYNGSYNRSAETVKKYLELYPSIRFVLDVHRDAIEPQKGKIVKAVADINGKTAAQVMIISGCDDGTMNMPNYFKNLQFAAALQDKMESLFPGLTRPVFFCYRKYNMDLSPGALLIEVGSHGNTLDEAEYSAELIGEALAELLLPQEETVSAAESGIREIAVPAAPQNRTDSALA